MNIFEHIVAAQKAHEPLVLATVIASQGSTPRGAGTRMLIRRDGSTLGTVGGGAIEKLVVDEGRKLLQGGTAKVISHTGNDTGTACGAGMSVFLEPLNPPPRLFVFGAGHIGAALAQIGSMLDFSVTVIDNRPDYADAAKLPWADNIVVDDAYGRAIEQLSFSPDTYIVILTHKHVHDLEVLEKCLQKQRCYIGMIGSRKKIAPCMQRLRDSGISEDVIKSIHTPIGIDIAAETPSEIAVSIAAELVKERRGCRASGTGSPSAA